MLSPTGFLLHVVNDGVVELVVAVKRERRVRGGGGAWSASAALLHQIRPIGVPVGSVAKPPMLNDLRDGIAQFRIGLEHLSQQIGALDRHPKRNANTTAQHGRFQFLNTSTRKWKPV